MTQRREYKVYYESELSLGIAIGPEVIPHGAEVFCVREVLPGDEDVEALLGIPVREVIEKLKRIQQLESQLAELREAVWGLSDYVDLPPSDYRTDDIEQAWDLFLKIYRDLQKETESELRDEAT